MLTFDNPETGGYKWGRYASTEETIPDGTIWLTAATLTVVDGTTITLTAVIDYTQLKELSSGKYPLNYLSLYARIGLKK